MKWFSRSAARKIYSLAGRPSCRLLKEVDGTGNVCVETKGERAPGGQVRSHTACIADVRRDRPGRANFRAFPVC